MEEERIQVIAIRLTPDTLIEIAVGLYDNDPAVIYSVLLNGQDILE